MFRVNFCLYASARALTMWVICVTVTRLITRVSSSFDAYLKKKERKKGTRRARSTHTHKRSLREPSNFMQHSLSGSINLQNSRWLLVRQTETLYTIYLHNEQLLQNTTHNFLFLSFSTFDVFSGCCAQFPLVSFLHVSIERTKDSFPREICVSLKCGV